MAAVKEMPYSEKLESIIDYIKITEGFAPRLVREELGREKTDELLAQWKKDSEPIPKDASDKDKYEVSYGNFMRNWVSASNLMEKYQGEVGHSKFMRAAIAAYRQKYAGSARTLRIVGGISSKAAFKSLFTRLAYDLQVFSPFIVSELNENRMILKVSPCRILETQAGNDFCRKACRNIIPAWLEEQFSVRMAQDRNEDNCSVIFEPFKK